MTANVNVTKVLFKRGNTAQNAAYTGINGEITVDIQAKTLRIHDGVTAGGDVINAAGAVGSYSNINVAAYLQIQNITSANIGGSQTFANANAAAQSVAISVLNANLAAANAAIAALQSNAAIQQSLLDTLTSNVATQATVLNTLTSNAAAQADSLNILLSNAAAQQTSLIDLVANAATQAQQIAAASTYSNANVASYLAAFDGNILPAANVTYTLGSSTRQWKELWISNNTVYIGGTPLSVIDGNLFVNGLQVSGVGDIVGNIIVNDSEIRFVSSSSGDGNGYSTMELVPDSTLYNNDQYLIIDPTAPSHIHIRAGGTQDDSNTELYLGGENSYFRVGSGTDPSIQIKARNNNVLVRTEGTIITDNIYTNSADFVTNIDPGLGFAISGWSQRNSEELELNLFVPGLGSLYTFLIGLGLGTSVEVTYSTSGGNETFTSTLSQVFSAVSQFDPESGWQRTTGRILGTLPANQTGIVSVNFPETTNPQYDWTFSDSGVLTASGNIVTTGNIAGNNVEANTVTAINSANLGSLNIYADTISMNDDRWDTININPNVEGQAYLQIPKDSVANVVNVRLHNDAGNIELGTGSGLYLWYFSNDGKLSVPGDINFDGGSIRQVPDEDLYIRASDAEDDGWSLFTVVDDGAGTDLSRTQLDSDSFRINTDMSGGNYTWSFRNGVLDLPGDIQGVYGGNTSFRAYDNGSGGMVEMKTISYIGDQLLANVTVRHPNVSISTQNALYNWTFDGNGDLTVPGLIQHITTTSQISLTENTFRFESNAGTGSTYIEGQQDTLFLLGGQSTVIGVTPHTWEFLSNGTLAGYGNVIASGNVVAYGNLITTSGVFWSNGVAYSSGGNGTDDVLRANVGAYQTYANTNINSINANLGAYQTYANATFSGGGGSTYSNANVVSMLGANSLVVIGNVNAYPTIANTAQMFVGSQITLAGGTNNTNAYLFWNQYLDAAGTQRNRNSQTGATAMQMSASGYSFSGTTGATVANAASGIGLWAQLGGSTFQTYNGIGITSAGTITVQGASGLVTTQSTGALFNTTATTINLGGAATALNLGTTNTVLTLGTASSGTINAANGSFGGNLSATNFVATNFSTANAVITGGYATGLANVTASGNVTAGNLIGYGSNTSIIAGAYTTQFLNNGAAVMANVIASYVQTLPITVASLISATVAGAGARAFVTDANTTTFGAAVGGNGANAMPVFSNGTGWFVG